MPKILLVEDDPRVLERYQRALSSTWAMKAGISVLIATTHEEAETLFAANPDIAIVVMDGCLGDTNQINTLDLVKRFSEEFSGLMIGASSDPEYRERLVEAGCSLECPKPEVSAEIEHFLLKAPYSSSLSPAGKRAFIKHVNDPKNIR